MQIIKEMAYNRSDAINRCADLGEQFISHFNKIMDAGDINDPDFIHHCTEMDAWYIYRFLKFNILDLSNMIKMPRQTYMMVLNLKVSLEHMFINN